MKKLTTTIFVSSLLALQGCFLYNSKDKLSLESKAISKKALDSTLSSVNVANNTLTINGSGFSKVTSVKIKNGNVDADLTVNSNSGNQIVASASSALALLVGGTFDLILSSADAQVSYSITFTLQDGAVTASKLANMNAQNGQVLKFNGTQWAPSDLHSSQNYVGAWDAQNQTPDLSQTSPNAGDYYVVSVEGDYTLPNPDVHFVVGDWIMFNGSTWEKVPSGLGSKLGLGGGTLTGDLVLNTLLQLKGGSNYVSLRASPSLASDITLTLPTSVGTNGQILTTNGSGVLSWTTNAANGPAGGDLSGNFPNPTISGLDATKIANGSVSNAQFQYLSGVTSNIQTQLDAKQAGGNFVTGLTGDVTATGPGSVAATVAQVGGVTAANVAAGANLANAATNANTASTIVKRDASGNFSAGTITGTLSGNATNVTGTVAVANGGTGATSFTLNNLLFGNGTSAVGALGTTSTPSVLLSQVTTGAPVWTTSTAGNVLKGSVTGVQFGALSASDLPSGTLSGSGTTNYVPYYSAASTLANSPIAISGSSVGIGTTSVTSGYKMEVAGGLAVGDLAASTTQLLVKGGAVGGPLITLQRTTGATAQYSWGLAAGGLSFSDDIAGNVTANMMGDGSTNQFYIGQKNKITSDTRESLLGGTIFTTTAGNDVPGTGLTIQGGLGTGTGAAGDITVKTGTVATTGNPHTSTARMTIKGGTGNVGIGTNAPLQKLQVHGNIAVPYSNGIIGISTPTGNAFTNSLSQSSLITRLTNYESGGFVFQNGVPTTLMTIDGSGNVGIGMTPTAKLHVNGGITATGTVNAGAFTINGTPVGTSTSSYWNLTGSDIYFSSGKVGIGTTSPQAPLHVVGTSGSIFERSSRVININPNNGALNTHGQITTGTGSSPTTMDLRLQAGSDDSSTGITIKSTGSVGIGTTSPSEKLHVVGNILASGTITGSSDKRLKKDIHPIQDALEKLDKIVGVKYFWINPEEHNEGEQIGVIAQDVEKVFPEAVLTGSDGMKSVSYMALVAPVIQAVKELHQKVKGFVVRLMHLEDRTKANEEAMAQANERLAAKDREIAELKKRLERIEKILIKN